MPAWIDPVAILQHVCQWVWKHFNQTAIREKDGEKMEPKYQPTIDLAVDLPNGIRPLTAEYFVDWLIAYKGLSPDARENVISNLKNDYQRVELQGALKQAMSHPQVVSHNHFSLFGRKDNGK